MAAFERSDVSGLFEVYVSGIPTDTSEEYLTTSFSQVGSVKRWHKLPERLKHMNSGFIGYDTAAEALQAVEAMDGFEVRKGLFLAVHPARKKHLPYGNFKKSTQVQEVAQQHGSIASAVVRYDSTVLNSNAASSTPINVNEDSPCAVCGKFGPLQCIQCKAVRYCGSECQRKHWTLHQRVCLHIAESRLNVPKSPGMIDIRNVVVASDSSRAKITVPNGYQNQLSTHDAPVGATIESLPETVSKKEPEKRVGVKNNGHKKKQVSGNKWDRNGSGRGSPNKACSPIYTKGNRVLSPASSPASSGQKVQRKSSDSDKSDTPRNDQQIVEMISIEDKPQAQTVLKIATSSTLTIPLNIGAKLTTGQKVKVCVVELESPSHFNVQLVEHERLLIDLQKELQLYYSLKGRHLISLEKCEVLVAALYKGDQQWYRARVLKQDKGLFHVRYVDYGNEGNIDKIFLLEKNFHDLPIMCISCGISGITSASNSPWSAEANHLFGSLLGDGVCDAIIIEHTPELTFVDLLLPLGEKMSNQLVEGKHACLTGGSSLPPKTAVTALNDCPTVNLPPTEQAAGHIKSNTESTMSEPLMASSLKENQLAVGANETVMVTDASSPLGFTVQAVNRDRDLITELTVIIQQHQKDYVGEYIPKKVGELILGEFSNEWCRGEVLNMDNPKLVCAFFMDYGNQDNLTPQRMAAVNSDKLMSIPVLGLKCVLHGIESAEGWLPNLLSPFITAFALEVKAICGEGLLMVEMMDGTVSINKKLVEAGVLLPKVTRVMMSDLPEANFPLETSIDCMIVDAPKPTCVRVQVMTEESSHGFKRILEILADESIFTRGYTPKVSEVVAGYYGGAWNRAVVVATKVATGQFKVRYIDWGNVEVVDTSNIAPLVAGLEKLAPISLECGLVGVAEDNWNPASLSSDKQYKLKLVKTNTDGYSGELYDQDVLVNTKLTNELVTLADLPQPVDFPIDGPVENTCTVLHVDSPAKFFVIQNVDSFKAVYAELQKLDRSKLPSVSSLVCGQIVCANIEGDWYRMCVKSKSENGLTANLTSLDYGFTQTDFEVIELHPIPKTLLVQFPPLAIHCCLPQVTKQDQVFDQKIIEQFVQLAYNQEVRLTLIERRDRVCVTRMRDLKDGSDVGSIIFPNKQPAPPVSSPAPPVQKAVKHLTDDMLCKQVPLEDSFSAMVTHDLSPSKFYVQSSNDANELAILADKMTSICAELPPTEGFIPDKDDLCFGLNPTDSTWYRCVVIGRENEKFQVQFLDYGDCAVISWEHIRPLTKDMLQYSAKAYSCQLADVFADPAGPWSAAAVSRFHELVSTEVFAVMCRKNQTNQSFYLVDLKHKLCGNVADVLVSEKLAVRRQAPQEQSESVTANGYMSAVEVENQNLKMEYETMKRKMEALEAKLSSSK